MASPTALWLLAVIALTVVEGLALALLWRYRHCGVRPGPLFVNLMAGIGLLCTAVAASVGARGAWLLACLAVALVMHLLDLRMRWIR